MIDAENETYYCVKQFIANVSDALLCRYIIRILLYCYMLAQEDRSIERADVLPQNLVKSWSREIRVYALKINRHLGSTADEMPVKFQGDSIILTSNLVASRLHEIWW